MSISAEQIRAALGALNWSRRVLADRAGLSERTIHRAADAWGVPSVSAESVAAIRQALESGGIEFLDVLGKRGRVKRAVVLPPSPARDKM